MSNDKIKFYKNPKRAHAVEPAKPYTPQYQLMGVEPREHKGGIASAIAAPSTDNPRVRSTAAVPQPYGERVNSPLGRGKGPMLNVGNNVEHSWAASVDGQIVDDLTGEEVVVKADHPMIDNNDFVTPAALGISEELPVLDEVANPPRKRFTQDEVPIAANHGFTVQPVVVHESDLDLVSAVHEMEEGAYLLMVNGVPVCCGPQEEIQEQARLLVFGEHELCANNPTPIDDIVILRRAKVKVGLFIE